MIDGYMVIDYDFVDEFNFVFLFNLQDNKSPVLHTEKFQTHPNERAFHSMKYTTDSFTVVDF